MEIQKQQKQQMLWKESTQRSVTLDLFSRKERMLTSQRCSNLTMADALKSGAHFAILRKWNEKEIVACVTLMFSEFLMLQKNNYTGEQIVFLAQNVVYDFDELHPDDVLIILRNAKQGKYSKEWGNFSYSMFSEWVNQYLQERDDYVYNKHLDTKERSVTREENKHIIFKERQGAAPREIKLTGRIGDVIADENYFKQK